jgi:50S ribosomal protein L16 3-hydroxylase
MLQGLADEAFDGLGDALYRDPQQLAVSSPAAIPQALGDFARQVVDQAVQNPDLLGSLLGEYLTEPKSNVWFGAPASEPALSAGVQLDRRSKMLYDQKHIFINGESFRVAGKDARLLRVLADDRALSAMALRSLSPDAKEALLDWAYAGWLHARSMT